MEPKTGGLLKTELQASITKLEEVWEGHLAQKCTKQLNLLKEQVSWDVSHKICGTYLKMMLIVVKWFQNNRMSSWIIGAAIQLQRSVAPVTSGWFTTEKNRWNRICQSLLWKKITICHSAEVRSELWNRTGGATSGFPWNLREKHGQFPQIIHGLSSNVLFSVAILWL